MRNVSLILTLLLLLGFYAEASTHPTRESAAPYHARVAALAKDVPLSIGDWTGTDNTDKVPPAAVKMLRPNVLLGRSYRNDATRMRADIVFVQCLDSRDMGGHYPPVCYRAQGWAIDATDAPDKEPGIELMLNPAGRTLPAREYDFRQSAFPADKHKRIYSFFVIPGVGPVSTLPPVRKAAEDYMTRPYGAAQIQVIFYDDVGEHESRAAAEELLTGLLPLIDSVEHKSPDGTRDADAPPERNEGRS